MRMHRRALVVCFASVVGVLSFVPAMRAQGETVFTGYTDLETDSTVLGILHDGVPVSRASAGQIVEVILADSLNVVDLVNADTIIMEQAALATIQEVYG